MAVGLTGLPTMHPVAGVRLGTTMAGLRKANRRDLVVIECTPSTEAAATFTRNRFCAAPVHVARAHLESGAVRALVINTGFANAGTGDAGLQDANATCAALAHAISCNASQILPFSTGVIGERFPLDRLTAGLPSAVAALSESGWADAAYGIMTTDTVPKGSSRRLKLGEHEITITGITKGAGMIRPDMATMLAFIATDAAVGQAALAACISDATDASFNRITIDGDTSTNDACVLLATGRAGNDRIDQPQGALYERFRTAVREVCIELAQAIVRDGEGATKFITVEVIDGDSEADCLAVAYTIAHSPLVKTAFFASDPNWGRLLAAVGRAPIARLDVDRVAIWLNDTCVVRNGALAADYTEAKGREAMRPAEIHVRVSLGLGHHRTQVWTCDFSHDYVRINADYRS
ncbi:MAG: bifunctional glutamate N-acetyltransferase/amino-acid acetyltransferase ArgJ [Gammaproteobacteria bacterium]|nr:bifunctional glutamate N-acetyltransferase/amino-acid acetyltransferase ArgJ [Gammaproteobacteria bacterium]